MSEPDRTETHKTEPDKLEAYPTRRDVGSEVQKDEITIVEVVVDHLDREWWNGFRQDLLELFQQDELLIRVTEVELL